MKKKYALVLAGFVVVCCAVLLTVYAVSNTSSVETNSNTAGKNPPSSSEKETVSAPSAQETSEISSAKETESNSSGEESTSQTSSEGQKQELSIQDLCEKSPGESIEILESYGLVLPETYTSDPKLAEESITIILQGLQQGQF